MLYVFNIRSRCHLLDNSYLEVINADFFVLNLIFDDLEDIFLGFYYFWKIANRQFALASVVLINYTRKLEKLLWRVL